MADKTRGVKELGVVDWTKKLELKPEVLGDGVCF